MEQTKQKGSTLVIVLVVALLAVIGIAVYMANDDSEEGEENEQTEESQNQNENEGDSQSSASTEENLSLLESALAGNASIECDYSQDNQTGTAYMRANGDFRINAETPEGGMHMIKLDNEIYMWSEGETGGYIFDAAARGSEKLEDQFTIFTPETFEESSSGVSEINCRSVSSFDNTLFETPENVEFQSMAEAMQGAEF